MFNNYFGWDLDVCSWCNFVPLLIIFSDNCFPFLHICNVEYFFFKLSDFFEDNIRALPSENCEEDVIQQLYIQVIEQFGTHFTTEVVMGAKAVQEFKFKNSDLDIFQSVGISAKVRLNSIY